MKTDIDLSIVDGDIQVENGQFKLVKNEELISQAVLRRIKTPLNSYSTSFVDVTKETVTILDNDYGNLVYELTAMDSQLVLEKVRDSIVNCLTLEPRITFYDISSTNDIIEGVNTIISYYINDNADSIQNIVL